MNLNAQNIIYCDLIDLYFNNNLNVSKSIIKTQYLELLGELTHVSDLEDKLFESNLNKINSMGKIIVGYLFDNKTNEFELVGSGTVIIEPKIIRSGKSVAHIEDIVVKSSWRGKKISQSILNKLNNYAKETNCYKVILDCVENVSHVYKSNGFEIKGLQMSKYL
jgi:glucosamine-phosphate N-acetyltransferase